MSEYTSELDYLDKKRAAVIKLAKEHQLYELDMGDEMLPVYVETLTEEMKQLSREMRRLAKALDLKAVLDEVEPFKVLVDGEYVPISTQMRRYCTRISRAAGLMYTTAYIDFSEHEEAKVDLILDAGEEDDDG